MTWQKYEQIRVIGKGSFGEVWLCRNREQVEEVVAIKMIPITLVNQNTLREIRNHQQLSIHPHVIAFKEVFVSSSLQDGGPYLCIVMEYAEAGSLRSVIAQYSLNTGKSLPEDLSRWCFQQHVLAMHFCHKMQIVNRDIKPDNLLVMQPVNVDAFNIMDCAQGDLSNAPVLKLADFGYSKSLYYDPKPISLVGTPTHIAPEIIQNFDKQASGEKRQTYDGVKADIWSSGVTLFELLTGTTPFQRVGDKNSKNIPQLIMNRVKNLDYHFPYSCIVSDAARDLVGKLLVLNPEERLTTEDIFQHPWFRQKFPISEPEKWTEQYVIHANQNKSLLSQQELDAITQQIQEAKDKLNEENGSAVVSDAEALKIRRRQRLERANRKQNQANEEKAPIPMYTVKEYVNEDGEVVQQWVQTGQNLTRDILRTKIMQHLLETKDSTTSQMIDQQIQKELYDAKTSVTENEQQEGKEG
eukprot:TRINITY_DN5077_c0_g1_i6.p1 TRINITY_DN5077_c0_g1~~TRINITY_DN5077_c0_g1_i6.p1  ORF type:complete len:468 (-),score=48.29 TRINITY_DN5077_c0_g1_i6:348-1751(-)